MNCPACLDGSVRKGALVCRRCKPELDEPLMLIGKPVFVDGKHVTLREFVLMTNARNQDRCER